MYSSIEQNMRKGRGFYIVKLHIYIKLLLTSKVVCTIAAKRPGETKFLSSPPFFLICNRYASAYVKVCTRYE